RAGCPVIIDGVDAGRVTSGTQTPFLKRAIGMAYVPVAASQPGQALEIDIRGRRVAAKVVPMPFYKRTT
ncbi:MAG TPA: glycine cleavage T C-terminal barrel domain-containing protein, partial [Vicinamibacterales bacterium]|nr:glycine cleavage T C-terminal barrel domain-containing protein [Vicinamibacterales bacterium]